MEPSSSSSSTGDEEGMEQSMQGPEQSMEEKKNLVSSKPTLPNRRCRICYAPEDASGADPILHLECACKGDIGYGHQSCLKKWFRKRFQRNGNQHCEVCRSPLGARVKEIIWSFITAEVIQHAPRLLLLIQIPPNFLNCFQVPLELPDFYHLPSETRGYLESSFRWLEEAKHRGQGRRREAFETAQSVAARRETSGVLYDEEDYLSRMPVDELLVNNFLELSEVSVAGLDPRIVRLFGEHPHPSIHTARDYRGEEFARFAYPEGCVVRMPVILPEGRWHPCPEENLLAEVSMQAARIVDIYGEDLILLPNFMDTVLVEIDLLLSMPASEIRGNDDDIAFAGPDPVLNRISGGPAPASAEATARTDSTPSRRYTYGRLKMFELL